MIEKVNLILYLLSLVNNKVYRESLLTHEAPDRKPYPGDCRQLKHEVDVDQHG